MDERRAQKPDTTPLVHTEVARPRNPLLARDAVTFEPPSTYEERYASVGELGKGGMGIVRACRDEHLGRVVAIKALLGEHLPDREQLDRFLREARIQAQLEHPSIVPVYDLGVADGTPFITMKRVRGTTLDGVLNALREGDDSARERFPLRRLLTTFGTVCQTIEYAHSRGVVHRDLKPANVMLGDFGEVYVLDWGVAKIVGERERPGTERIVDPGEMTVAGAIVGTPDYMAPEQQRGDHDAIDARTDVFALGALLFEIVTLDRFAAKRPAYDANLSPELLAIATKASSPDPNDRYPSARALYEAVDQFLAGEQDIERRKELARAHARLAASTADRSEAMREVGRALALDPANVDAVRTLVSMMSEPPKDIPPEVAASVERAAERSILDLVPLATFAYLAFIALSPVILWMGVRHHILGQASFWFDVIAAVAAWRVRNARYRGRDVLLPALVTSTMAMTVASTMYGPFIFVPALAVANTVFFVIQLDRRRAYLAIVAGCIPIAVPALLSAVGIFPSMYRFEQDRMTVLPWMHGFPSPGAPIALATGSIGMVLIASLLATRFRESLAKALLRIELGAWQLRQLLPQETLPRPADSVRTLDVTLKPRGE
jgi:eukaryotic-like serine/threonine-protein kinase